MSSVAYDVWVAEAKAVDIVDYARSRHELSKLHSYKDGYIGPCPNCGGEDRFVITSNHKKKVFRCRHCQLAKRENAAGDVIKLVMFLDECSFHEAVETLTGRPMPPPERESKLGKIVDEYSYTDESGDLLFQVVRFDPKAFRQRRPDGKGGWIWNLDGVRLVPYRLPAILAAVKAGQPMLVVEGEKDVATAEALGLVATCAPGGVGMGWRDSYDQHFAGADVIVVPDNDDDPSKGPAYARIIASHLDRVARRVRWLALPSTVKDLSAWREAGGTRPDLDAMIAAAPEFEGNRPGTPEDGGHHARQDAVSLDDFHAYMPQHNYIYVPSREPWPAASVNARIQPVPILDASGNPVLDENGEPKRMKASAWLDQNRPVEQMTWAPGRPMLIRDRLVSEGGWIERRGVTCFNLYRPPTLELGDASQAGPWLDHVHKVFGDDADHIIRWLAHRVQRPQEKINHALVFGSNKQGTGKDTALEPVKRAIGPWNFQEVSPQQVLGRFNGFLKRVILRVNEARDLGDVNRYQFYDHMKAYTAAPPDVLRVDEKNLREHSIINCVGIILTTNYKSNGIYLPAEDRRHFVAWSNRTPEEFADGYWNTLWGWYDAGGDRHVAAYLAALDLSSFDPKAPPPKTRAFWDVVDANRAPEDAELADVLDRLGNPLVTT
jgi:hypothetical protein